MLCLQGAKSKIYILVFVAEELYTDMHIHVFMGDLLGSTPTDSTPKIMWQKVILGVKLTSVRTRPSKSNFSSPPSSSENENYSLCVNGLKYNLTRGLTSNFLNISKVEAKGFVKKFYLKIYANL